MTRYYHTTDSAEAILDGEFRDGTGGYMFATLTLMGVFLGDSPMTVNEGAQGDQVLAIDLDEELDEYELLEDGKPYREWCVPAALINEHADVTLLTQEQLDEMWLAR